MAPRRVLLIAIALAPFLGPDPARAHPHEFVEAALTFHLDAQGALVEIGVEWRYDPFTSMLILSDQGLNPAVTDLGADAAPELQGFDLDWIEGYNGDLWALADGAALALAGPVGGQTTVEAGQVVSRHSRALLAPVDPRRAAVVVQVYDPEFYIAYTIAGSPAVEGATGCRARVMTADLDTAQAVLEAALAEVADGAGGDIEMDFPRVGRDFADEIQILCD